MKTIKALAIFASTAAAFSCAHRLPAPPGTDNRQVLEYQVQEGESLLTLGQQYAVAPLSIQRLNHLGSDEELKPGQLIYIPVGEEALESTDLRGRGKLVDKPAGLSKDDDARRDVDAPSTGRRAELYSQYRQIEWPLENGLVRSHFGPRSGRRHAGLDIFPKTSKEILAAEGGTVEFVGRKHGYGNTVVINHKTFKTLYAHCSKIYVHKGEAVDVGEKIAHVGATGNAHGAHLHFEYQGLDNLAMDPLPHLSRDYAH